MLIQETSLEVFTGLLDKFQCYWDAKEPEFITYIFQGALCCSPSNNMYYKVLSDEQNKPAEKWANVIGTSTIQTQTQTCSWKGKTTMA